MEINKRKLSEQETLQDSRKQSDNMSRELGLSEEPAFQMGEREQILSARDEALRKIKESLVLQENFQISYKDVDFEDAQEHLEKNEVYIKQIDEIEAKEKELAEIEAKYGDKEIQKESIECQRIFAAYYKNQYGDVRAKLKNSIEQKQELKQTLENKNKSITEKIAAYKENAEKDEKERRDEVNTKFENDKTMSSKRKKRGGRKDGLALAKKGVIGATEETAAMMADMQHRQKAIDKWKKKAPEINDKDIELTGDEFAIVFKNRSGSSMNVKAVMEKIAKLNIKINDLTKDHEEEKKQLEARRDLLENTLRVVCAANGIDMDTNSLFEQDTEKKRQDVKKKVEYANAVYRTALEEYTSKVKSLQGGILPEQKEQRKASQKTQNEQEVKLTEKQRVEADKSNFKNIMDEVRRKEKSDVDDETWNAALRLCTSYDSALYTTREDSLLARKEDLKSEIRMLSNLLKGKSEEVLGFVAKRLQELAKKDVTIENAYNIEKIVANQEEYSKLASIVQLVNNIGINAVDKEYLDKLIPGEASEEFYSKLNCISYMKNYADYIEKCQNISEMSERQKRIHQLSGARMEKNLNSIRTKFKENWEEDKLKDAELEKVLNPYEDMDMALRKEKMEPMYDEKIEQLSNYQEELKKKCEVLKRKRDISVRVRSLTETVRLHMMGLVMQKQQKKKLEHVEKVQASMKTAEVNKEKTSSKFDKDANVRKIVDSLRSSMEKFKAEEGENIALRELVNVKLPEVEKLFEKPDYKEEERRAKVDAFMARKKAKRDKQLFQEAENHAVETNLTGRLEETSIAYEEAKKKTEKIKEKLATINQALENFYMQMKSKEMSDAFKKQIEMVKEEQKNVSEEVKKAEEKEKKTHTEYECTLGEKEKLDDRRISAENSEKEAAQKEQILKEIQEKSVGTQETEKLFLKANQQIRPLIDQVMAARKNSGVEKKYNTYIGDLRETIKKREKIYKEHDKQKARWEYYFDRREYLEDLKNPEKEKEFKESYKIYLSMKGETEKESDAIVKKEIEELKKLSDKNKEAQNRSCNIKMDEAKKYLEGEYFDKIDLNNTKLRERLETFTNSMAESLETHEGRSDKYHKEIDDILDQVKGDEEKYEYILSQLSEEEFKSYILHGNEVNLKTAESLEHMVELSTEDVQKQLQELESKYSREELKEFTRLESIREYLESVAKHEEIPEDLKAKCYASSAIKEQDIKRMGETIKRMEKEIDAVEKVLDEEMKEQNEENYSDEAMEKAYHERTDYTNNCFNGLTGLVNKVKNKVLDVVQERKNEMHDGLLNSNEFDSLKKMTVEYQKYLTDSEKLMKQKEKTDEKGQKVINGITYNTLGIQYFLLDTDEKYAEVENLFKKKPEKAYHMKKDYFKATEIGKAGYTTVDFRRLMYIRKKLIEWLQENDNLKVEDSDNKSTVQKIRDYFRTPKEQRYDRREERLEKLNRFLKLYCEVNGVDFETGQLLCEMGESETEIEEKVKKACLLLDETLQDINGSYFKKEDDEEDDEEEEEEEKEEEKKEESNSFFSKIMKKVETVKNTCGDLLENLPREQKKELLEDLDDIGDKSLELTELYTFLDKEVDKSAFEGNMVRRTRHSLVGLSTQIANIQAACKASVAAGKVKDEATGEEFYTLGLSAEAGASVCLLSQKFTAKYGTELLGLETSVEANGQIDIGAASANASLQMGLLDEKGKFNPTLALEAGAEAALLKLSGNVGAKLFGVGVNANASLIIGAAAKLGVKFENWKLTVDCAAAVGIGFSVKLEFDFSGLKEKLSKMVLDKGGKTKDKLLELIIRKGYGGDRKAFYRLMEKDISTFFKEKTELFKGISEDEFRSVFDDSIKTDDNLNPAST